jgi:hypothetical protein
MEFIGRELCESSFGEISPPTDGGRDRSEIIYENRSKSSRKKLQDDISDQLGCNLGLPDSTVNDWQVWMGAPGVVTFSTTR